MPVQSPCVARCGLNDDDYCMGCYRHIDEIVAWSKSDDTFKQGVVDKLQERKSQFTGDKNNQILSREKWLNTEKKLML